MFKQSLEFKNISFILYQILVQVIPMYFDNTEVVCFVYYLFVFVRFYLLFCTSSKTVLSKPRLLIEHDNLVTEIRILII